jgi:pheromone shutdown protein TraB
MFGHTSNRDVDRPRRIIVILSRNGVAEELRKKRASQLWEGSTW